MNFTDFMLSAPTEFLQDAMINRLSEDKKIPNVTPEFRLELSCQIEYKRRAYHLTLPIYLTILKNIGFHHLKYVGLLQNFMKSQELKGGTATALF